MFSDEDTAFVYAVQEHYSSLDLKLPLGTFTILAAIALTSAESLTQPKIIALATGCKCLPKDKLPLQGEAVHDSHAEVLARRCAVRWLFEEIDRAILSGSSHWVSKSTDGRYCLKDGVKTMMYISTPPCEKHRFLYLYVLTQPTGVKVETLLCGSSLVFRMRRWRR
jgi:tRNA-specific adenosine deaminase 1